MYEEGEIQKGWREFIDGAELEPFDYFAQGEDSLENGDLGRALEYFTKAISLEPGDVYFFFNRGKARFQGGML